MLSVLNGRIRQTCNGIGWNRLGEGEFLDIARKTLMYNLYDLD
jgi:hypothetical protein